jgi:hypothetical protein
MSALPFYYQGFYPEVLHSGIMVAKTFLIVIGWNASDWRSAGKHVRSGLFWKVQPEGGSCRELLTVFCEASFR